MIGVSVAENMVFSHNVYKRHLTEFNFYRFLHYTYLLLLLYLFYCSLICVYFFVTMSVVVFTLSSIKLID